MEKITLLTSLILGIILIFSTAVIAQEPIPFNDGFEDGSLAGYWTPDGSGTPFVSESVSNGRVYSGTYVLDFNTDVGSTSSVEVELESAAEPTLSFWYYFGGYELDMTVDIKGADGTWDNDIWTDTVPSNPLATDDYRWLHASIDLSGYDTSGSFKLRFKVDNPSGYNYETVYMDEVWVGGPSNPDPFNSSDNPVSGTLTWDHALNVSAYTYDVKFGKAGSMDTVASDVPVSGSSGSYSYSNLDYGTEYEWQIVYNDGTKIDGPVWSFHTEIVAAGDGTPSNPYQISSVNELIDLSQNSGYWQYHFVQIEDIFFSSGTSGFSPIGNAGFGATAFSGTYDGSGHEITGLTLNRPGKDYVGLFGRTSGATIKNVQLTDVDIAGDSYVGGLVGGNDDGTVDNCSSSGSVNGEGDEVGGLVGHNGSGTVRDSNSSSSVTGTDRVGGLVGWNALGIVNNSTSSGDVEGSGIRVGGLVGWNWGSTVKDSTSSASVTGTDYVGGLVGRNSAHTDDSPAEVENCTSSGDVEGSSYVGGLVGHNTGGTVDNCSSSGSVTGTDRVGGLVGHNADSDHYSGTVSNSYSTGSVEGSGDVGGLVGRNSGTVDYCGSSGRVTGTENKVGGLVGTNGDTVSSSYSTGSVNGEGDQVGGLVGANFRSTTSNSYSTGSVTGSRAVGGLVGFNFSSTVEYSYSTGSVTGSSYVGGLVGFNRRGTVEYSFWDTQTSGIDSSGPGTGKDTTAMKASSTFTAAGWTFGNPWMINNGSSRPFLAWQDVAVDNGYPSSIGATSVEFPAGNIHNNSGGSRELTYGYMYRQIDSPTWTNSTIGTTAVSGGDNIEISATSLDSLDSGTTYYARAYGTNENGTWYGDTVKFTTETNDPPNEPTNPLPIDDAENISTSPTLEVDVSDPNGDSMDVTFYDGSDDSVIGTDSNVSSGSTAEVTWSGLDYGTGYSWYVVADDGSATTQSSTWNFTTNDPPTADANGPYAGDTGESITLDGTGSSDTDGSITSYAWDLDNDGSYDDAAGSQPTHSWSTAGTYTIGLEVTDDDGATDTETTTVDVNETPTVTTTDISSITPTSAESGGNVTSNGGSSVTARGVCWSTSEKPTTANDHTTDGSGTGEFTSSLTGLTSNTIYHVRAYATNSEGTDYGEDKSFTTPTHPLAAQVPTLSEWGMIILSLLLAGTAFLFIKRKKV